MHRVGRTGRAGQTGTAISLFTPEDAVLQAEVAQQLAGRQQEGASTSASAGACYTPKPRLTVQQFGDMNFLAGAPSTLDRLELAW